MNIKGLASATIALCTIGGMNAQNSNYSVGTPDGSLSVSDMGAAIYNLKFDVPDGGPLTPQIGLSYNSQSTGYGLAGYGVNITGISCITRGGKDMFHNQTVQGITYTTDDNFYLDGQRLILKSGTAGQGGAVYTVEGDPYTKVSVTGLYSNACVTTTFVVEKPDGTRYHYGDVSYNSYLNYYNGSGNFRVAAWYINKVEDVHKNTVTYKYEQSDLTIRPTSITYGTNSAKSRGITNKITFTYNTLGSNSKNFYIEDHKGKMNSCLSSVTTSCNDQVYRKYTLNYNSYSDQSTCKWTRLTSVTEENGKGEKRPPITFVWNYLPSKYVNLSQISVQTDNSDRFTTENDKAFFAADLNGDGISDMIRISPVSVIGLGDNMRHYWTYIFIYESRIDRNGQITYSSYPIKHMVDASFSMGEIQSKINSSPVLDFDGDGYNDLVISHNSTSHGEGKEDFRVIYGSDVANRTCGSYRSSSNYNLPPIPQSYSFRMQTSNSDPLFAYCDTNGDGKDDIICLEKVQKNGTYPGFIMRYKDRAEGTIHDTIRFCVSLNKTPQKLFTGDYNNDGLTDLLILHDSGYKIYYNNGGKSHSKTFVENKTQTGTNVRNFWRIEQGDFNGDGQMDFVYSVDGETCLRIAYNKGNGTFNCIEAYALGFGNKEGTCDNDNFSLKVWDADHDGRSDVMVCKAGYTYHGGFHNHFSFNDTKAVWLLSDGNVLQLGESYTKNREDDSLEKYLFLGDFDGDGFVELANYGSSLISTNSTFEENKINIYKSGNNLSQVGKITGVTDGFGNVSSIQYAFVTNPSVYKRASAGSYPVNTYTLPISVVSKVTRENGVCGSQTTNYTYEDLKIHVGGRGMLGFCSVTKENASLGMKETTKVSHWNEGRWLPDEVKKTITVGNNISTSISTFTIANVGGTYFSYVSKNEATDFDGNKTVVTTQYNTKKGVIIEKAEFKDGDDMYKTVSYSEYVNKAGVWLPQTMTTTRKHKDDSTPYSNTTTYKYDDYGNITSSTANVGSSMELTTTATYDAYGNVRSTVDSGYCVVPVTQWYDYDESGLHVVKSYTNPASTVYRYTYDNFGNLLTETDETNSSHPLTTTHTYDNWSRRKSTLTPEGVSSSSELGWGSTASKKYYIKEVCTGKPAVTTWYDKAGHEVESLSVGLKGVSVKKATSYNSKGEVQSVENKNGLLTLTQSFTYDERGRVKTETSSTGKSVTYTYGNRSVTKTFNGRNYTKSVDAWGNVLKSTDPIGTVEYTYFSNGQPKQVKSFGSTVSMTYDEAGNQTSLTDPDAGTMTYTYAADGTLLSQTDGRGVETINTYDELGRLSSSAIGQKVISYQYGKSGNAAMRLTSQSMDGNVISYTYDSFGRVTDEARTVSGQGVYSFAYTYNDKDQLACKTYPGGLTETYTYDDNGFKTKTAANGKVIYNVDSYDGLVTTSSFAGKLKFRLTRNSNGYETSRQMSHGTTILEQFLTNYDTNTDNLLSRQRNDLPKEEFTYDNLDRLVAVNVGGTETMCVNYAPNGNILSKTGVGDYSYDGGKPHSVTRIDNLTMSPAYSTLQTEFNDFGKIQYIVYDAWLLEMDYMYGPDQQRWYSTMTDYTGYWGTNRTTVYVGDYEKVTENGVTREFYYLDGNTVMVKQNGVFTPYLAFTDNLGSILSIMDEDGNAVFDASYDAWGQQTVSLNEVGFHRGYTGHEMLNEYGIINMNGRLYDPFIGRFFSPDNYVQSPDNSQNFNRYSYCLNNPLKYNDPDGESFVLAAIIGAAIGTYMGGTIANGTYNPTKWDFSSAQTWGFMFCGGMVGAASGYVGAAVAASGIPAANTLGIMAASSINSIGSYAYTLGETPISVSAGAVSYDFTNKEFGYLGKKGNSTLENIGYGFGTLANLPDIVSLIRGGGENVKINSASTKGEEHEWWGHSSATRSKNGETIVSVGPDSGVEKARSLSQTWRNSIKGAKLWETYLGEKGTWSVELNNISTTAMDKYASNITRWDLLLNSCVGHTTRALWSAGVPTIYAFHPHMLNLQLVVRQVGIYSSPYLYQINK